MFSDLLDFGLERSVLKALGFYIFYLVTFMVFGVVITLCSYALFHPANDQSVKMTALHIGKAVAFIGSNMLCLGIGIGKGYKFHIKTILMMFISGTLSFVFGAIGGLIPAAFFTMFKANETGAEPRNAEDTSLDKVKPD